MNLGIGLGGLAGGLIAPSPRWATLPIGAMFLGTVIAMFPASMLMARVGRRAGFVAGALMGTVGGLVAAEGVYERSLFLLSLGTCLMGAYAAFAQFYRFAASEVADEVFRPKAISLVLAGGVFAAIAGPLLAQLGGPLLQPAYTGSFLIIALVSLAAAGVLLGLRMPSQAQSTSDLAAARPWQQIVLQPAYLVALFGAATGFGIMIMAMTATPLAMAHHQHGLGAAATVIQVHVLAMFLPSFFTGALIERFGVVQVMLAGVLLFLAHVTATLTGTGMASFAGALILLGVGWNFLYIGGTTLLTSTYSSAEKARPQAINDLAVFVIGLACSMSAGALLDALGWSRLNLALIPWLLVAAASLVWLGLRTGRLASATPPAADPMPRALP
ncbi:MAG: MFS transporter [Panacagrimonas sp.]